MILLSVLEIVLVKLFVLNVYEAMADKDVNMSTDWSKCVLCQETTTEPLQYPGNTRRDDIDIGTGYHTLASNILRFHELESLPIPIDISKLDEGDGIADTFITQNAKWHKSCKYKFSNLKLQRAEKRKSVDTPSSSQPTKFTRKTSGATSLTQDSCFFCGDVSGTLHQASTFNIDARVRKCALQLQDRVLLSKLSAGDMISQEAVYHAKCLVALYNKAERLYENTEESDERVIQGIALAQLIAYIEDIRTESADNIPPVFRLADLTQMYSTRLQQLGGDISTRVHSSHLKDRILANIPGMQAHKQGRDVLLVFEDDIGLALKNIYKRDFDNEAMTLLRATTIIRRDIMNKKSTFKGLFANNCQQNSVPESLKTLVGMILGGPDIMTQSSNMIEAQTTLSISQLILFNSTKRRRGVDTCTSLYHSIDREPPVPVYLGLMTHAETRKRTLVDKLYNLGLSISYDRVLDLSTDMGNDVCARFESEGVVCPPKLRKMVFTTAAVDNIDHNPSSTTAQGAFHGTGVSLFQHPSIDAPGEERDFVNTENISTQTSHVAQLPDSYTNVQPVILPKNEPVVPVSQGPFVSSCLEMPSALSKEYKWLNHARDELNRGISEEILNISWSAFHASQLTPDRLRQLDVSSLLPLFQEEAASAAMIRHAMDVVGQAVRFINPGQVPILACDQPLFAISKKIQWNWPSTYGENKLVVMFGGFHTELAALKAIGKWIEDSGWTNAIVQAGVTTPGTADSFLKASHVSRTRHAHQVTASALYILMHRAYNSYCDNLPQGVDPMAFGAWRDQREAESPQFHYWSLTLQFQLTIFIFVRSLREGNFQLYKDACTSLAPWFFALDHTHYSRWLPVHIRDMEVLDEELPSVAAEFRKGHFVVQKTHHTFSSIPIDQAHEQNNKIVKGDGGAIGLTGSSTQLLRWMVSGPEISRVIHDFESSQELLKQKQSKGPDLLHHEQMRGVQATFQKQLNALCSTIEEMGNPFLEQSEDLLVLDTRDIMDSSVSETVRSIEKMGLQQYKSFVSERLDKRTTSLYEPIKRNNLPLFSSPPPSKQKSNDKMKIASLKSNCSLFSRLYVSCQVREGNLEEFFCHENQSFPPSLSQFGKLRSGSKSDLLSCLEKVSPSRAEIPSVDALLLDGAAIVNILKPGPSKTFEEYSHIIFLPYVRSQLQNVCRIDVVWDRYIADSLKNTTRSKRGKGIRRRVKPDTRIPGNWAAFLRVDENKEELFHYLAEQLMTIGPEHGEVISTKGEAVVCNGRRENTVDLSPCKHEEADTRLLLHATDAAKCGFTKVMLRTVDTDVVVIAVGTFHQMPLSELWIAFGVGKHLRYLPVHDIACSMGPEKSRALLTFHAFTGSDQTSSFANRGKKTAWEAWDIYNQVTPIFQSLSNSPSISSVIDAMPMLERYVVIMYDRTSTCETVNDARKDLFTRKGRAIDAIPPTADALLQHTKRSMYQAGHCWGNSMEVSYQLPCPSEWGWMRDSTQAWEPLWTTIPQASQSCQELLKCGCKSERGCTGRCKCIRAELPCTALCNCSGHCNRD